MADTDKRLRYFNGQFLQQEDFTAEQDYHLDRQRRHNQLLHSHGIAEGLDVTADAGETWVTVSSGTALDEQGRMIVLPASRTLQLGSHTGSMLVVISYDEQESDPATVGDEGDTRFWERPKVEVIPESGAPQAGLSIPLARLELSNGKISQHDTSVRTLAGKLGIGTLKAPDALGFSAQFVKDQNGNQSALAISTGKVGIGTKDLECIFTVSGNVSSSPLVEVRSHGDGAAVRYKNKNNDGDWYAGVGPANNFFFLNKPTNGVALFTPAGTLTANGADMKGDLSVAGNVLVTGTVDGRDLSADGQKLDVHAGSTNNPHNTTAAQVGAITGVGGLSNPGGNIGITGDKGITITPDNTTKSVKIANAAGSLTVQSALGASAEFVKDQSGNQSPLALGTGTNVGIGTKTPGSVLTVAGNISRAPIAEMFSEGDEASVRYRSKDGVDWHVGLGGIGGLKNFFFWNNSTDSVGKVVATITPDGSLTTKGLKVSTDASGIVCRIEGNAGTAPLAEVNNQGNEASIRYVCKDSVPWHVGTGGHGGADNLFFWSQSNGVVGTITPEGTLTAKGLKADTNAPGTAFEVAGASSDGPIAELKSTGNETSIRYSDNDGVDWISGTGGQGGTGNFFFWNSQKQFVAKISPDGTLALKGGLTVEGGLSMRRIIVTEAFGQLDVDGTVKTVHTGFQPKFISMEGRAHAWLGAPNAHLSYGGALGGFCQVSDGGQIVRVTGHGPHVARLEVPPYLTFFNAHHANESNAFGSVFFMDHTLNPKLRVYIEVLVESITPTGFKLKLSRKTDVGFNPPAVFGLDMSFAVLG